jgi:hypothetical protein
MRSTFQTSLMDSFFRASTLTVPTADRASTFAADAGDVAAAGDQCLSAFGLLAIMVVVLPFEVIMEVVPFTLDELAKEFSRQLDEAVKELVKT